LHLVFEFAAEFLEESGGDLIPFGFGRFIA
jgi:hypothetical protein